MLCIGFGEAQTGEGLSPHRVVAERTPHPIEFGSTGGDALSHKGRGRINWQGDESYEFRRSHCWA